MQEATGEESQIAESQILESKLPGIISLWPAQSGGENESDDEAPTENSSAEIPLFDVQVPTLEASPSSKPTSAPTEIASSQPEAASAEQGKFPTIGGTFGLDEFIHHFAPYEPMYFIGGATSPNIKFQFSLRYRLITPTGPLATKAPWVKGFNFAYSQTSFWDTSHSQLFFTTAAIGRSCFTTLKACQASRRRKTRS